MSYDSNDPVENPITPVEADKKGNKIPFIIGGIFIGLIILAVILTR